METIEERAKEYANKWIYGSSYCLLEDYINKALTEQDSISRKEERERCIKAFCKTCYFNKSEGCSGGGNCDHLRRLREAMKGGNNG